MMLKVRPRWKRALRALSMVRAYHRIGLSWGQSVSMAWWAITYRGAAKINRPYPSGEANG